MSQDRRLTKGEGGGGSSGNGKARNVATIGRAEREEALPGLRHRRKVLREEEYLCTLGAILRRDFFPQLDRLETQYEYLSAMERNDLAALRDAATRLTALEHRSTTGKDSRGRHSKRSSVTVPSLSLDEFQARYVTEDTADFEALLERFNAAKRTKFAKIFKNSLLPSPSQPLLTADPAKRRAGGSRGQTAPANTRLERDGDDQDRSHGSGPADADHHYWEMVREYGGGEEQQQRALSVSGTASQTGYEFVATPAHRPAPSGRKIYIPPTPSRPPASLQLAEHHSQLEGQLPPQHQHQQKKQRTAILFKKPAVQRLLRAHTPHVGSVFDPLPNNNQKTPRRT